MGSVGILPKLDNCRSLKEEETELMRYQASKVATELPKVGGVKTVALLNIKTGSKGGHTRHKSVLNTWLGFTNRPPAPLGLGGELRQSLTKPAMI